MRAQHVAADLSLESTRVQARCDGPAEADRAPPQTDRSGRGDDADEPAADPRTTAPPRPLRSPPRRRRRLSVSGTDPPTTAAPPKQYGPSVLTWSAPRSFALPAGTSTLLAITAHNPTDGTVTLPHPLSCTPRLDHAEMCPEMVQLIGAGQSASANYTIDASGVAKGRYTLDDRGRPDGCGDRQLTRQGVTGQEDASALADEPATLTRRVPAPDTELLPGGDRVLEAGLAHAAGAHRSLWPLRPGPRRPRGRRRPGPRPCTVLVPARSTCSFPYLPSGLLRRDSPTIGGPEGRVEPSGRDVRPGARAPGEAPAARTMPDGRRPAAPPSGARAPPSRWPARPPRPGCSCISRAFTPSR